MKKTKTREENVQNMGFWKSVLRQAVLIRIQAFILSTTDSIICW